MSQQPNFGVEQWIIDLAGLSEEAQRREFLAARTDICNSAAVESLYNAVVIFARVDLQKADRVAQASSWIAAQINDPCATAQSARAVGHVLYLTGKYQQAIVEYEKALAIFEQLGRDVDYARTISGALQSLIYDGQYERAFRLGERARSFFTHIKTGSGWQDWTAILPISITGRIDSRKRLTSMNRRTTNFFNAANPWILPPYCETWLSVTSA